MHQSRVGGRGDTPNLHDVIKGQPLITSLIINLEIQLVLTPDTPLKLHERPLMRFISNMNSQRGTTKNRYEPSGTIKNHDKQKTSYQKLFKIIKSSIFVTKIPFSLQMSTNF